MSVSLKILTVLLSASCLLAGGVALVLAQSGNYEFDRDGDGLIEISYLEQLEVIRYDLDGNGSPDPGDSTAAYSYAAAFAPVVCEGKCKGYELVRSLDFQDGASYASGEINTNRTSGSGWNPIGRNYYRYGNLVQQGYNAIFEGNGHTISNLYINLYPKDRVGLFSIVLEDSMIRNLGLVGINISYDRESLDPIGQDDDHDAGTIIGGLAGVNYGSVFACYTTGRILSSEGIRQGGYENSTYGSYATIGGLIGINAGGDIGVSYSTVDIQVKGVPEYYTGYFSVGGLSGTLSSRYVKQKKIGEGTISNSYSSGEIKVSGPKEHTVGGLVAYAQGGTIRNALSANRFSVDLEQIENIGGLTGTYHRFLNSVWDTQTTGQIFAYSPEGGYLGEGAQGKTTAELKAPTGYTGIYHTWNTGGEDFWDFGTSSQYPVLKVDFNGDGEPTWWEFGPQIGNRPVPPPTPIPTPTATATPTPPPTFTPTPEPTNTATPVPTDTPISESTSTSVPASTSTDTPVPADTPAPEQTTMAEPTSPPAPEATELKAQPTDTPEPVATSAPTPTPVSAPEPTDEPEEGSNGGCGAPSGTVPLGALTGNLFLLIAPLGMIWGLKWRSNRKRKDSEN